MKYLLKFLILSTLLSNSVSFAGIVTAENKFIEVLEGICLLNKDDFSHIDKMAIALKMTPLPQEQLQGDSVIANRGGKGYILNDDGETFMIGYANGGGCSVAAQRINLDELEKKLLSVYKLQHVQTSNEGMQITNFYRFSTESVYSGDYLMITHLRERGEKNLVSVGYLPKNVYLKTINENSSDCIVKNVNLCELAKNAATKMNSELPKTLGNITYTSVVANGKQITHSYNVSYGLQEAAQLTNLTAAEIKENQHKMVYHMVCDDKYAKQLLDYGISITYVYKFNDGAINQFIVSDCKNF